MRRAFLEQAKALCTLSGVAHGGAPAGSGSCWLAPDDVGRVFIQRLTPSPTSHAVTFAHSTPVHDQLVLSRCVTARQCLINAGLVVNLDKFIVFIATVN